MKIAMLTDTYDSIGGTEQVVKNSANILSKLGCEVKIFYPDRRYRVKTPLAELVKFNPDIIHVHTPGPLGNIGVLYGKARGIPVVGGFHSLPEVRFYFEKNLEKKTIGEFLWKLIKFFYKNCDITLVPTEEIKKILESKGFEKISIVSYGIDLSIFKKELVDRAKFGFSSANIILLYAGWFRKDKRVDILIDAVRSLEPEFKLLLVGDGNTKKKVAEMINKLGANEQISIYDPVPNQELVKFYSSADIYVNASVSETQGLSMVEAMACSLPVVAAASPGAKEIIQEGKNGYLAEINSAESLAEKINFLREPQERQRMGKYARMLVEEKYSLDAMGRKLLEVYESLK